MFNVRLLGFGCSCLVGMMVANHGFAWGQKGHQMINKVAVSMVNSAEGKQFLAANKDQITYFASTPDLKWKSGESANLEKPLHWFEIDGYSKLNFNDGIADLFFNAARQQIGAENMSTYGMALWRVSTLYDLLVTSLKKQDYTRAIQVGGVMGHYVGDMTQPMHATTNYDGQSINKPGVHKYYETTLVDQIAKDSLYNEVVVDAGERRHGLERTLGSELTPIELQHAVFEEADGAFNSVDEILQALQGAPDDQYLIKDLKPRLAKASALLGKIWDSAFVSAHVSKLPHNNLNVQEPTWIPMPN
jgi:hypothetical protein